jgi:hypothetical protein
MNGYMLVKVAEQERKFECKDLPTVLLGQILVRYNKMQQGRVAVVALAEMEAQNDPRLEIMIDQDANNKAERYQVILEYADTGIRFTGVSPDDHDAAYILADAARQLAAMAAVTRQPS